MRRIGDIQDQKLGQRFINYLCARSIDAEMMVFDDSDPTLWVIDEDHLEEAEAAFKEFVRDPHDRRFDAPERSIAKPVVAAGQNHAHNQQIRPAFETRLSVTATVIALSVLVTLLTRVPSMTPFAHWLYFSEQLGHHFPEIASGQVWRLVTPIFLHGGLLHLAFNMYWFYQLGGMIERVEGSAYLFLLTIVLAVLCNTSQYLVAGAAFIGISGVVYGLLGYVWMMSRFHPARQYALEQQLVVFMVIWMIICLVGIIPNVANTQHVVGFAAGVILGFLRSGGFRQWKRQRDFKRKTQ